MRDDFTEDVKRVLAHRVCNRCSNPDCRRPTSGPQLNPTGYMNVGVAAHITAASPGGKRYDAFLSGEQRKHANNGIWLCQTCGKLVDNDETRFSLTVLRGWKRAAEAEALASLVKIATSIEPTQDALSQEEIDLLVCAAEKGDIRVLSSNETGSWVSVGSQLFIDSLDPAVAAIYVESVDSLCARRLARHDGGILFVLTGTGFRIARALKALLDTNEKEAANT